MSRLVCVLIFVTALCRGQGVIVIDAGHGGAKPSGTQAGRTLSSDNNAVSPGGLKEKEVTLELAQRVIARINAKKGRLRAVPTRTADVNPDFAARAKVAADSKAVMFVSLHFNAVPKGAKKASGTLGMVQARKINPHYKEDAALAGSLTAAVNKTLRAWLPDSKALPVGDDHELHGGQGSNLFYQLRAQVKLPVTACFLEVEFMDNPAVEKAILGANRGAVFDAVAGAIADAVLAAAK